MKYGVLSAGVYMPELTSKPQVVGSSPTWRAILSGYSEEEALADSPFPHAGQNLFFAGREGAPCRLPFGHPIQLFAANPTGLCGAVG